MRHERRTKRFQKRKMDGGRGVHSETTGGKRLVGRRIWLWGS